MDEILHDAGPELLVWSMMKTTPGGRRRLRSYAEARQNCRVATDGSRLKALGFQPGPLFGELLKELYRLRLDGEITSEEAYIRTRASGQSS